jgi:DNA-binding transcriptional ArsR family regulator
MDVSDIFGGKVRGAALKTLSQSVSPLTANRIARINNLDPATTYRELKALTEIGLVKAIKWKRRQTAYMLVEGEVGRAIQQLVETVEAPVLEGKPLTTKHRGRQLINAAKCRRASEEIFRRDVSSIRPGGEDDISPSRAKGELEALAILAKKGFEENFKKTGERAYRMRS